MLPKRLITLAKGIGLGALYALIATELATFAGSNVSLSYVFIMPIFLGAIPVLFTTKEQIKSYYQIIILPWMGVITFCLLAIVGGFEGVICLVVIIAPFLILGTIGGFIARLIRLKKSSDKTPLYCSLLIPFLALLIEPKFKPTSEFHIVKTTINIDAAPTTVWKNIKNVRNIRPNEPQTHFIHMIGIPKPLNGSLDGEGIGAIRTITWEKGIKFQEVITQWHEGSGFKYDINVDPNSIPPTTLDEHVMIGGKYFDAVSGSYHIIPAGHNKSTVELTCRYRISTSLNFYSKWWADFILDDFNNMILEVIKKRCEVR